VYVLIFYPGPGSAGEIEAVFETREDALTRLTATMAEMEGDFPDSEWAVERHYLHLATPSLASETMEPEKLVGEPRTPRPNDSCDYYDYGKQIGEWECAPVAIRDRRVIWDWVKN
jgi:hypothetical protein